MAAMVIPSDITRWGFVQGDSVEGDSSRGFDKSIIPFTAGKWMFFMDKNMMLEGIRRADVYFEGKEKGRAFLKSPKDVYDLLLNVGYLQ